jgi:aryl-alcohol dehydrogenase-like predicted oxidoreductase
VEQIVKDAIDIGYRHLDCAMFYANEKEVGAGIRAKIAEGVIKREDIFVTSKVSPARRSCRCCICTMNSYILSRMAVYACLTSHIFTTLLFLLPFIVLYSFK